VRPVAGGPAAARVRTQVLVPLAFPDGFETTARVFTFDGLVDGLEHLALGLGDRAGPFDPAAGGAVPTLTRLHSECLTGDVFGSQRCDCGAQLRESVGLLDESGGFLLYLRQEGRGIGLYAKLDAYVLQDTGLDTYEANVALGYGADERDYTVAAQMLGALGVSRVALLSNNPDKAHQLRRLGVTVVHRVPTGVHLSDANAHYLATKAVRGAHTLDLPAEERRGTA
jgi:GTP cyclohydrolase II